jgi:hypothetical protein
MPAAIHIQYLGDFDRSGRDAAKTLEEKLERFGTERGIRVYFRQLAIEESDVSRFDESNMTAFLRQSIARSGGLPARPSRIVPPVSLRPPA